MIGPKLAEEVKRTHGHTRLLLDDNAYVLVADLADEIERLNEELRREKEHGARMKAHASGAAKRERAAIENLALAESKIQSLRDKLYDHARHG